jgi:hypothetical protein
MFQEPLRESYTLVGVAGKALAYFIPEKACVAGNFYAAHSNRRYVKSEFNLAFMNSNSRPYITIVFRTNASLGSIISSLLPRA